MYTISLRVASYGTVKSMRISQQKNVFSHRSEKIPEILIHSH